MWENSVVTDAGKALLQKWAAGGTLTIEKAKAGAGTVDASALAAQTDVTNEKAVLSIISAKAVEGGTRYQVQLTALSSGYTARQIGIFGRLDSGSSTMIALYQDDTGIAVPSSGEMPDFAYTFYASIISGTDGVLNVTMDTSALITLGTLEEKLSAYGDMKKSVYDADNDGVVDNAKKLDGKSAGAYAAASHTHAMADVTDLQSTLNGKASASHTHPESDIDGLTGDLAGKADSEHTHEMGDVTGLYAALNAKINTTYTISVSGTMLVLTPSDGSAQEIQLPLLSAETAGMALPVSPLYAAEAGKMGILNASASQKGAMRVGDGLTADSNGTVSNAYGMSYADGTLTITGP